MIVLVVIRNRPDADLDSLAEAQYRMHERIAGDPAFDFERLEYFAAADGAVALIGRFSSPEGLAAWRADPEHLVVKERGRSEWLESYWGGEVRRRMDWSVRDGRAGYDESHPAEDEPITIAFSFKLRADADTDAFQQEQFGLLQALGEDPAFEFRDVSAFQSEDGSVLLLVTFGSPAGLRAWATDPDHMAAMERGRKEWVEHGWTGELVRWFSWDRQNGRTVFPGGPA